jgi:hypothetical protein
MFKKIINLLITFWNIIAITVIMFVIVNILIWGLILARNAPSADDSELVATTYSIDGVNDNKINLLLRESSAEQFVYEPFTQFKETPLNNLYMNVSPYGFRSIKSQGPWPINPKNINIFVFGGSTIFGYGATDYQTIPSYLQEHLRKNTANISVYNFGRAYYYSTQQRILFENLLNTGNIPDIVIFVNGLTDFFNHENIPALTKTLNHYNNSLSHVVGDTIGRLPIMQLFNFASAKLTRMGPELSDHEAGDYSLQAQRVLRTYLNNQRIIKAVSSEYNIKPFFVWQPTPFYNSFRKLDGLTGWTAYSRSGYELMNKKRLNNELSDNFIWLSNLNSDSADFIDLVHYSPNFSARIAASVSNFIFPYLEKIIKFKEQ